MQSIGIIETNNAISTLHMAGLKLGIGLQHFVASGADEKKSGSNNPREKDDEQLVAFGKQFRAVIVQSPDVSLSALETLERSGVQIFPSLSVLRTVKYADRIQGFLNYYEFPTCVEQRRNNKYQKSNPAYLRNNDGDQMTALLPSLYLCDQIEVPSSSEVIGSTGNQLLITIFRDRDGNINLHTPATTVDNHTTGLSEMTLLPSTETNTTIRKATNLAVQLANNLKIMGLLAVRFSISPSGSPLILTFSPFLQDEHIASLYTHQASVAEQYLRLLTGLTLAEANDVDVAVSLNVHESEHFHGAVSCLGHVLSMNDVQIHWLGYNQVGSLVGQVIVKDSTVQNAISRATTIRQFLRQETANGINNQNRRVYDS